MRMEEGRGEVEVKRKKCEGSMKREKMMGKGRTKKKQEMRMNSYRRP